MDYANRALERLWNMPGLFEPYARYRLCANEGCITWPRELETIEAAAVDAVPVPVRSGWYEFIGYGPGNLSSTSGRSVQLLDRGQVCTFDEVQDTKNRVAVNPESPEDAGKNILIRYLDSNKGAVYTDDPNGDLAEGEYVEVPPAGTYSYTSKGVSYVYGVVKPITKGSIRLYEYAMPVGPVRLLAVYQPDETVPVYRRSLLSGCGVGSGTRSVQVMGRLRLKPIRHADDVIPIPHLDALRLGVQAIRNEESGLLNEAAALWQLARQALDEQAAHQRGAGADEPLKLRPVPWHEPIKNII